MKKRRFFYHYRKQTEAMSVHWDKKCHVASGVTCLVPTETKWNSDQPKLVIQGWANSVTFDPDTQHATIQ